MQPQQQDVGGAGVITDEDHNKLGDLGIAEAASPISSRPPAPAVIGHANFEEMLQATAEAGGSSGNRWPRQETLTLLQIRSEMDAAFRDATLKGPLWEQVSRKLAELGYKRSAKKCKEKFENVHKYYKRTKEGRGGRHDGKSYKFFTQLEALNLNTATTAAPTSSLPPPPIHQPAVTLPPMIPQPPAATVLSLPPPADQSGRDESALNPLFASFSSHSSSSSDDEMETAENPNQRKRKRVEEGDERMMDFFDSLLKQVMQKQEGMQQKFLEAIEKREQDRMIREEAWKRQDMARIAREHELMAQERAVAASRDAAIVAFLEKITGQTIHLPAAATPPPPPPPPPPPHHAMESHAITAAVPEQQMMIVPHQQQQDLSSSRWPKTEVLALIQLRSGMEAKYQEAGPKGALWEEISAGMQRMGYSRSPKRCKEKWENINKYFKKVKESNKKRPEDAKTCPYFHELDALYRKKAQGQTSAAPGSGPFSSAPFGAGGGGDDDIGGEKQPEDMLIKKQNQESRHGDMIDKCSNSSNSDENYEDENEEEFDVDDDDKTEEEMKMMYKIQFQRPNHVVGSSNATGGIGSSSTFLAMVQ
ncbi:hypothetical protein ACS0TY_001487 [Phlomoides rotata]